MHASQAGGNPLRTYSIAHERLKAWDTNGDSLEACEPITTADIDGDLHVRHEPIINWAEYQVTWREPNLVFKKEYTRDLASLL